MSSTRAPKKAVIRFKVCANLSTEGAEYSSPRSGPTLYSLVPSVKTSGSHESGSTETKRAFATVLDVLDDTEDRARGPVGAGAERGAERLVALEGEQRFVAELVGILERD